MFMPFEKVVFLFDGAECVLYLTFSARLLIPIIAIIPAIAAFWTLGPLNISVLIIVLAVPSVVVVLAALSSFVKLRRWWNDL
jgi:hypothetical protein